MRTKQALNLWESLGKTLKRIDKHNAHKIDVDSALHLCRELYTELLSHEESNESVSGTGNEIAEETKTEVKMQETVEVAPAKEEEVVETMPEPEIEDESIDSSVMFETETEDIANETEETSNNIQETVIDTVEVAAPAEENISTPTPEPVAEAPNEETKPEQIVETVVEPIAEQKPEPSPEPIPESEPVPVQPQTISPDTNNAPQPSLFGSESKPKESLGESLGRNIVSKNETMAAKENNDLASKFQAKPVTDIKAAISLGDRFLFIKELFNGNADDFNQTIQQLNNKNSIEDAKVLLSMRNWDADNETVKYFHSIIQRKYISN